MKVYWKLEFGIKVFNAPTNESTRTKKYLKKITPEEEEYCEALDAGEKSKKSFGTRAQVDHIKGGNLWCHLRVSLKELLSTKGAFEYRLFY